MELFKRILLSIFPDEMANQPINPITMFISFISAKQFFSVINRRIVENYKLNLFDISLDSFEVKVGFGEQPNIKVKDIDFYYSYGVVSNFNGYRFFSPANMSGCISIVSAIYISDRFSSYRHTYFTSFIMSVFLLSFVFISRLKVFPNKDIQSDYKWFIEVFFEFFQLVLEQSGENVPKQQFDVLKNDLLKDIQLFFMLFYFYRKLNGFLYDEILSEREFYNWLFYDELKKGSLKTMLIEFVDNYNSYTSATNFTHIEKKIMNLVFPADILIRYLLDGEDVFMTLEHVVSNFYDKDKLDEYINSFLKNDDKFEEFMTYITDYTLFRDNYFRGIKKFMIHKFQGSDGYESGDEEIEEFISTIGENANIENVKIPDRLKKESMIMEKFINFYMTFIGGFWIARGDNNYIRLFRRNIMKELMKFTDIAGLKQDVLYFYGGLLYSYSKNVFYYKYAFENVRAGKEKFNLPFRSTFREVYSNMFILKLFDEDFIGNLLQDINPKDIKIYVKNKQILSSFKELYGPKITNIVNMDNSSLVKGLYGGVTTLMKDITMFDQILLSNLKSNDLLCIKESIYTIDFWFWHDIVEKLNNIPFKLSEKYSDFSIIGILSFLRDTWFGFMVYYKYLTLEQKKLNIDLKLDILKKIYVLDILGVNDYYYDLFDTLIKITLDDYDEILINWINLDSNDKYLAIGFEDWLAYSDNKDMDKVFGDISGEDIIWFRGYLKNINYYNKRFLIPRD